MSVKLFDCLLFISHFSSLLNDNLDWEYPNTLNPPPSDSHWPVSNLTKLYHAFLLVGAQSFQRLSSLFSNEGSNNRFAQLLNLNISPGGCGHRDEPGGPLRAKMKFVRFFMKHAALASVPKHIEHFSKFSPSPLSMKQFLDFGE